MMPAAELRKHAHEALGSEYPNEGYWTVGTLDGTEVLRLEHPAHPANADAYTWKRLLEGKWVDCTEAEAQAILDALYPPVPGSII